MHKDGDEFSLDMIYTNTPPPWLGDGDIEQFAIKGKI